MLARAPAPAPAERAQHTSERAPAGTTAPADRSAAASESPAPRVRGDKLGGTLQAAVARRAGHAATGPLLARFHQKDPPTTLVAQVTRCGAAGSGVNGALWIEDATGTRLWLKAERAPTERQVLAEAVLGAVGVRSTNTVQLTRADARALYEKALLCGDADAKAFAGERLTDLDDEYHHLMGNAPGLSPEEFGKKVQQGDPGAADLKAKFVAAFRSESFAKQLGRLLAADQFLGNADRITRVGTVDAGYEAWQTQLHPGNFKIAEDVEGFVLYAIDNDAYFESADRVVSRIEQAVNGALLSSSRADGHLVFAAGVRLLFDQAQARQLIAKLQTKFYTQLGGSPGALMHGYSREDAQQFETWALEGWSRGRQLIMLALPAIKRTFEEMHGSLGGEKHTRTVLGFEEDDFRIRKVYTQFASGLPDLDEARRKTEAYFSAKQAGGAGPFGARLQQILAPLAPADPLDALVGKADALSQLAKDVARAAKDEYSGAPGGARKLERLHLRQFVRSYTPEQQLDMAFEAFRFALAPPPAAAAVGPGPRRRGHVMETKEQTQARIERIEAAGFMTGPLRELKKAVGDAAKLIATSHGAKAAEASKPLPKYAHH